MKKLRVLCMVLRKTRAGEILLGFVGFLFLVALVLWAVEPGIETYREAVWYCCALVFTTGFGDVVAVTFVGRVCSILISCYSLFAVAVVTGVVVAYFNETVHRQYDQARLQFLDRLERLPELSPEELEELSRQAKQLR
ncbi:MAG: two pore domain potassium channel family protein [Ruminiclostridium sp.]|nr:two pore domain potassium channel family protein [Ruminiclostridium sp.]